jgi:hypothetical protein
MKALPAVLMLAVLSQGTPATAHFDEPVPQGWAEWAMRQYSQGGNRCCDATDAHLFRGRYEIHRRASDGRPDGATLYLDDGRQIDVPQNRMLRVNPDDINPTGYPVWWYVDDTNTWCFGTPGPLV